MSLERDPFVKVKDMIHAVISRLEKERVVEQFAGGAWKALANRDDTEGNMYAGMCTFKDVKQEAFKCDTVDATDENGNASTYGGGDFDGVCFSLVPGIVWQCFPEHLQNELCSATPKSDGMFPEQSDESNDNEDHSHVPGVADESRERRMRRQPSEPLNQSFTPGVHGSVVLQTQVHGRGDGADGLPRSVRHPGGEQHGTGVDSSHSDKVRALPKTQRLV